MAKPVATLILQRNLPKHSDTIGDHIVRWNGDLTDVYVIESGSDPDKLSKHPKFWANWPEAVEHGLHFSRGTNYGLLELEKIQKYDFYFICMGDTFLFPEPTIEILLEEMAQWPKFGIISPISPDWGEYQQIQSGTTKCHWLVAHVCWMIRSTFLDAVKAQENPSYMNYFYDGENYLGYDCDTEIIIKAYLQDFAVALTAKTRFVEQRDLKDRYANVMKTEATAPHQNRMYREALEWMKKKYNFDSKWEMRAWTKRVYEEFMQRNPEYQQFRLLD